MYNKVKYSIIQIIKMISQLKIELLRKFVWYMFLRYICGKKTDLKLHNFYGNDIYMSNDG